jgi:hypothetical protein
MVKRIDYLGSLTLVISVRPFSLFFLVISFADGLPSVARLAPLLSVIQERSQPPLGVSIRLGALDPFRRFRRCLRPG